MRVIDISQMQDLGLAGLLPISYYLALGLLTLSFLALLFQEKVNEILLGIHVVLFIAIIHGTPTLLYDSLRYAWAWKHVGISDFILRHGYVDTSINSLGIYHNFPGFFSLSALLSQVSGSFSVLELARWGTLVLNYLYLPSLLFLFKASIKEPRLIWLSLWIFFSSNWVGQDYFSPQGLAFLFFIVLMGLYFRYFTFPLHNDGLPQTSQTQASSLWAFGFFVLTFLAIVSSHQLTPVLIIFSSFLLVFFNRLPLKFVPILFSLIFLTWLFYPAADFTSHELAKLMRSFGQLGSNVEASLSDLDIASPAQQLISWSSRLLTLLIWSIAATRIYVSIRTRRQIPYVILALAPFALLLNAYGGEVLFRVYLFALPFMAVFVGDTFLKLFSKRTLIFTTHVFFFVLLAFYLPAYYGKDNIYRFTEAEVEASTWLHEVAPENSLIIEGTRNYPTRHYRYEAFTYLALDYESDKTQKAIMADPVGMMKSWLKNENYSAAYLIITRSQKAEVDQLGIFQGKGSLAKLEQALLSSNAFEILYQNEDAVVFGPKAPLLIPNFYKELDVYDRKFY
ncbi:MAG: hypothetical protein KC422_13730 [Trueperaceae bacterium]|nr:hypothetical protein [Trueperaceae bacterium]